MTLVDRTSRLGIEKRPAIVEERKRLGDWEADTNHQGFLVTLVERTSRTILIAKVPRKEKDLVAKAILAMLQLIADYAYTI